LCQSDVYCLISRSGGENARENSQAIFSFACPRGDFGTPQSAFLTSGSTKFSVVPGYVDGFQKQQLAPLHMGIDRNGGMLT